MAGRSAKAVDPSPTRDHAEHRTPVRIGAVTRPEGGRAAASDPERDRDRLGDVVGYHLRLAQEASFAAFTQRVGDPDLKPGRYSILTILSSNPGLTPTALSRACGRDKSTLTSALKDLEKRGLVERESMPGDQRSVRVSLTEAGNALLARLRVHAEAHDRVLDRIVGPDNKAAFIGILERITKALADGEGGANTSLTHPGATD